MFTKTSSTETERLKRARLPALAGVRILAAMLIYLFHIKQAHDARILTFGIFSALPEPPSNLVSRGYVSTGFFFLLSGFLLAYAYLDQKGRLKVGDLAFWKGRLFRLYPLYFLSLLLLLPAPALLPITAKHPTSLEIVGGMTTSLTLTQAWFPQFALWWNAPAWALSAFATFYAVFPAYVRITARLSSAALWRLTFVLAFAAWLPALAYLAIDPERNAWTATAITRGGPWLNALRFNPLAWLPQFLAGVTLGRVFALQVDQGRATSSTLTRPSTGDFVGIAIAAFLALPINPVPYVMLRHGLLTPLFLVVLYDLARDRGFLSRFIAWRGFQWLGEASFSLFALQMPVGVWFSVVAFTSSRGNTFQLLGMISATLAFSILWAETIQRPWLERLRRRATVSSALDPARPHAPAHQEGRLTNAL